MNDTVKLLQLEWRKLKFPLIGIGGVTVLGFIAVRLLFNHPIKHDFYLPIFSFAMAALWAILLFESFCDDRDALPFFAGMPVSVRKIFAVRLIFRLTLLALVITILEIATGYFAIAPLTAEANPFFQIFFLRYFTTPFVMLTLLILCGSTFRCGMGMIGIAVGLLPVLWLSQLPAAAAFSVLTPVYCEYPVAAQVAVILLTGAFLSFRKICFSGRRKRLVVTVAALLVLLPWLECAVAYGYGRHLRAGLEKYAAAARADGVEVVLPEHLTALGIDLSDMDDFRRARPMFRKLSADAGYDADSRPYLLEVSTIRPYYLYKEISQNYYTGDATALIENMRQYVFWNPDWDYMVTSFLKKPILSPKQADCCRALLAYFEATLRTPPELLRRCRIYFSYVRACWSDKNLGKKPMGIMPLILINPMREPFYMKVHAYAVIKRQIADAVRDFRLLRQGIHETGKGYTPLMSNYRYRQKSRADLARHQTILKLKLHEYEHGSFPAQLDAETAGTLQNYSYRAFPDGFELTVGRDRFRYEQEGTRK
jgi:hypothetical protein